MNSSLRGLHLQRASPGASAASAPEETSQAIYGTFFGLRERPFDLTPNPRFLYLIPRQQEALSNLHYGLTSSRGFTLLVGEAGCGKTTILHSVLAQLNDPVSRYLLVTNPMLTRAEFYQLLTREFELTLAAAESKTVFLEEFKANILERSLAGGFTGLIFDEAQSLPYELLEEIQLLGNLETPSEKLLNIVLSGQPELSNRLSETSLRQLKQRIALRCELKPFDVAETSAYIAGRLRIAGGRPDEIFTMEAVMAIFRASAGLPRTVNVLCDNALIGGFAEQVKPVTARIVDEVAKDFDLRHPNSVEATTPSSSGETPPVPSDRASEVDHPKINPVTRIRKRFSFFMVLALVCIGPLRLSDLYAQAPPPAGQVADVPADYVIGSEDVLGIVFWRDAEMSGDVTVRPDGMITLPLMGDLKAVGLRPDALRDVISKTATKYLEDINVTVIVRQINSRKAFITGEIKTPNSYVLAGPRTVMQLIAMAGGLTEYAKRKDITIIRIEDGKTSTFKFNYDDVSKGKNLSQNIQVKPGDTVVVP